MFWQSRRLISIAATLAILFWLPSANSIPASAVTSCGSQAKVSGRLNFASKVETNRVLICADWLRVSTSKPTTKVSVKTTKIGTKKSVADKIKKSEIRYSHSASASPAMPRIVSSAGSLMVGQAVTLRALTRVHSRFRYLLGIPTEVRFTPLSYSWALGDGASSRFRGFAHVFRQPGTKTITMRVKFAIDFRFAGSKYWRKLSQPIWTPALPLKIKVSNGAATPAKPRYVFYDCTQVSTALGCDG